MALGRTYDFVKPIFLLAVLFTLGATTAAAQSYRTLVESRRVSDESLLRVDVEFAAGELLVAPARDDVLYRLALVYDEERYDPHVRYRPERGYLGVGFDRIRGAARRDADELHQRLDLALGRDVPIQLRARFGAVDADVELGGLSLREARFETGASKTTIRFSEPNRIACDNVRFEVGAAEFRVIGIGNAACREVELAGGVAEMTVDFSGAWRSDVTTTVRIDMGLGAIRLRFPENLGVRLEIDRFLVGLDQSRFVKRGSDYYSRNYDAAATRVTVEIDAALGHIEVDWVGS